MKKIKRMMAIAIAIILSLGVSNFVFAATITVENADPNSDTNETREVYTAYKISDAVKAEGTTITTTGTTQTASAGISYKISTANPWFNVLFDNNGAAKSGNIWFTASAIPGETDTFQVIPASDYTTEQKAKDAAAWLLENKGSIAGTSLTVPSTTTVEDGYYLITSSLGTNLGLATTDIPMTIVEKNTYPSIDKKQKDAEEASATYVDTDVDVQVGDIIDYQVVVWVPATANGDLNVSDTMSAGLDKVDPFNVSVKVGAPVENAAPTSFTEVLTQSGNYTIDTTVAKGWTAVIKATEATKGKYIEFTFQAKVNSDAVKTDTLKENKVTLDYSNYHQEDKVNYKVYATGVVKYDGQNNTVNPDADNKLPTGTTYLGAAEFQLIDKDGATVIPVSYNTTDGYYYPDTNGNATITSVATATGIAIRGLDNQTYYLKETKAPVGYNLLTTNSTLVVVLDANGSTIVPETSLLKVANNKGSILPSTGGMGTTIFYIIGVVLLAGAAIILVTKRRMNAE